MLEATAVPDILKALYFPSDATIRGSADDQEDLETLLKNRKEFIFSKVTSILIIYKFSQDLTSHRKKTNGVVVLSH